MVGVLYQDLGLEVVDIDGRGCKVGCRYKVGGC